MQLLSDVYRRVERLEDAEAVQRDMEYERER
jgi:hypothetical protein